MEENDNVKSVLAAPAGSVISFSIMNDVLENNQLELAFELLERYSVDNLNDKTYPVITSAAAYGDKPLFEKLISLGADILVMNHVQSAAVDRALKFNNFSGVRSLIDLGFDVRSYSGGKALRYAAWKGHLEMVRLFVDHGADVNFNGADQVFPYRTTPVQMAASGNHFEVVKYLVEHGADVTKKDDYGYRAFLEAKKKKNTEMMEYIKQLEPPIWHEFDKRTAELMKMGLPKNIIKWLGIENRRVELSDSSCSIDYIEFENIFDVKQMQWEGRVFLDLAREVDGFENSGFIIWIPDENCLGSFDVEHKELYMFKDVKWNKFMKRLPVVINHVLDGLPIDELYK